MTVYANNDDQIVFDVSDDYVLDILEEAEHTNECCHPQIIEDYIDIDSEKSVKIFYCDTCYITVNGDDDENIYTDEPPMTLGAPVEFMPLVDN